ncbi:MAG TPA: metal ABC transporter substrate-binding protein [Pseudomonadales bacterium]|jgi:zinc transport system substrate-binding protein
MPKYWLLLCLLALPVHAAPVRVLASIDPLALLARDVGGERVQVSVLLPAGSSPHHFALRPSQRSRLDAAALVFWGGPALERPLSALLGQRPDDTVLALQPEDTGHESHLWLNPVLMRDAAVRLAAALTRLDPAGETYYQRRLQQVQTASREGEWRLQQALAPYSQTPLLLDHDFLDAFWPVMGLKPPLVIRQHPESPPGTAHVAALAVVLAEQPAVCYLREAGAPVDALAAAVTRNTTVEAGTVNVLDAGPYATYDAYLDALGLSVRACLQAAQAQIASKKKP